MKTLVIINGVTGAIGTACLARFSREEDTVIYGLSRQAPNFTEFAQGGLLPARTLICSIGNITNIKDAKAFADAIDPALFKKIIYVHAVGVYPFELDATGNIKVSNDADGDGIDDRVVQLSHDAFFTMSDALAGLGKSLSVLIFGGIADKYQPAVHTSWWSVMGKVKSAMLKRAVVYKNAAYHLLNISSVICPHEILTRPFVFINTNADPRFWLMPSEVADKAAELTLSNKIGFVETDLYHASNYYHTAYFKDEHFTKRKQAELGYTAK
ncbi:MAG TPA: hypothetical protein VGP13_04100 [Candidatus Paceibacterota bacterium]|jgi:hypothetical protein|nr:hypothetical protein [Candidatus Paceibacterota bacterium]